MENNGENIVIGPYVCEDCVEAYETLVSKNSQLKSDLAIAVEALERIDRIAHTHFQVGPTWDIAKETLGKIKEKYETIPER